MWKMSNSIAISIMVILLAMALSGCGPADDPADDEEPDDPRYGGTITIGYISDVNYLNPIPRISAVDNMVNAWLHDSLVVIGPDGDPQPRLAEDWDVSEDAQTITFHLKEDVKWHDGNPFTAADVEFTVYTILNPNVESTIRPHMASLQGFAALTDSDGPASPDDLDVRPVEVIDDHTIQFNLSRPDATFIPMALSRGIIPRHLLEDDIAAGKDLSETDYTLEPVGLGPFQFVEWSRDERIVFERFDDYHEGRPFLERIVYEIIPDRSVASANLETGDIDFLWEAAPAAWSGLMDLDQIDHDISDGLGLSGVFLNTEEPPFDDRRVRQAMRYALDMEAIVGEYLGDGMSLASGPIPPNIWAHNPDIEPYPYDPTRAEELLAEAGWTPDSDGVMQKDGEPLAFQIETFDFATERQEASIAAQEFWADLGLEVDTRWVETTVLLERYNSGDYEAAWVNPTGDIDPAGTFGRFHSDNIDSGNTTRFSHSELDGILDEARQLTEQEERRPLYWEALEILHDEQPVLWAGYIPNDYWFNEDLTGFVVTPESEGLFKHLHLVYFDR